ncbi:hypothetical protein SLEP1_g51699 [Rubroshorea leprosula]|uniref:Uncharacterized protein n=1 Tax=Rubroshorea leprosula TaxID=152421 RepID=A0AAV5M6J9_9ROSI|nr:hypothetical protein SLEP1_g51699 [Rubroshorea leprosula]
MSEDRQIDPAIVHPSIALMQERFRQLERAKEIRQEKELLRMLPESRQINAAMPYVACRSLFHPILMLQSELPLQCTLKRKVSLQSRNTQVQAIQTPILKNLWSGDTVICTTDHNDISDVDATSVNKFNNGSLSSNPAISFCFFFMVQ